MQGVCGHSVCGHSVCGHGVCGHSVGGHSVCGHSVCGHGVCGHGVCVQGVCGHSVGGIALGGIAYVGMAWGGTGRGLICGHATDCLPIIRNPKLPELLEYLKKAGKKIFLLTNSPYKFTNVVMKYILDDITGKRGGGGLG